MDRHLDCERDPIGKGKALMMKLSELTPPIVIAHRGFKMKYPENTMASFEAAIGAGVKMIELDVTLSRDRRIIVIHDDTLDRTTNGTGRASDYSLSELKALDAGSWFDPSFKDERLPALEEVIDAFGNQITLNIEIKESAHEPSGPPDAIEKQVMDLVLEKKLLDSVLFSSFDQRVLARIRELSSQAHLSFLTEIPPYEGILGILRKISAFSWNPDYRTLLYSHIQKIHYAGFRVIPFTINDKTIVKKFLEAGIHGFFTDDPTLQS